MFPKRQTQLLAILISFGVLTLGFYTLRPAAADQSGALKVAVIESAPKAYVNQATKAEVARTPNTPMLAGESRHVAGRINTKLNTTISLGVSSALRCYNADTNASVSLFYGVGQNHEGLDAPYAQKGILPLYSDMLFTAPQNGTFYCSLFLWSYAPVNSSALYALAQPGADNSYIKISNTDQVGSTQFTSSICDSEGSLASCNYVGVGQQSSLYAFYSDGTARQRWTAPANATTVKGVANMSLTTCYKGTASCARSDVVRYEKAFGTNSKVAVQLQVLQMNPAAVGGVCHSNTSPLQTYLITDLAHHFATHQTATAKVDPACKSNDFIFRVYIKFLSGNPVKVGGIQSNTSVSTGVLWNETTPDTE